MLDSLGDLVEAPSAGGASLAWGRLPFLSGAEARALLAESNGELQGAAAALPWVAALVVAAAALPPRAWVSGVALCVAGAALTVTQARPGFRGWMAESFLLPASSALARQNGCYAWICVHYIHRARAASAPSPPQDPAGALSVDLLKTGAQDPASLAPPTDLAAAATAVSAPAGDKPDRKSVV